MFRNFYFDNLTFVLVSSSRSAVRFQSNRLVNFRVEPVPCHIINRAKFQTIAIQSLLLGLTSAQSRASCKSNLSPTTFPVLQEINTVPLSVENWEYKGFGDSIRRLRNHKSLKKYFFAASLLVVPTCGFHFRLSAIVGGILCNILHITSAYCP